MTGHTGDASPGLARVEQLAATNPKVHLSTTGSWLETETHHHLPLGES